MDTTEVFEALRPRLLGVAYRILGSMADAEDVLQDAWMRWSRTDAGSVANPEAYLVTVVGRRATDFLRAVAPRVAVPVHDALLSAAGRSVYLGNISRLKPEATDLRDTGGGGVVEV